MKTEDFQGETVTFDREVFQRFLKVIGRSNSNCIACHAPIVFVKTRHNRWAPFDYDLVSHYATCRDPDAFRRAKQVPCAVGE